MFAEDLVPVLGEQGLVGVHVKKSTIHEGVSTFYSTSKFKQVKAYIFNIYFHTFLVYN